MFFPQDDMGPGWSGEMGPQGYIGTSEAGLIICATNERIIITSMFVSNESAAAVTLEIWRVNFGATGTNNLVFREAIPAWGTYYVVNECVFILDSYQELTRKASAGSALTIFLGVTRYQRKF